MKTKLIYIFLLLNLSAVAQTQLFVPDTLIGPNFNLNMHIDSVQFFSTGKISHTYAFNNYKYLGPTLIFERGKDVSINVTNQIDDTTTVHWHGIHLPAMWDGGPHTPILKGESWNPQFKVLDHAATYWYHPHMHKKTAAQGIKGAAGLIIVRDSIEKSLDLPRKYGVDDFPIIVQSQQYDLNNQAMPLGMEDSTLLVNGGRANQGHSVYVNCPAQVVRFRILNASGERAFNFGLSGNKQFYQIGTDGGLLNSPRLTTRVRLAPGERAEILVDLTGLNGQTLHLLSYASEFAYGIQGGPTMPMPPGSPPMDSPLNGIDFNVLTIQVVGQTLNPITTIPTALDNNVPYLKSQANTTRTIKMTADNMMVMDGPFYFNNQLYDMMRIDYEIPLNNIEIWKLVNKNMVAHPFHIHDVQFYIIERNGQPAGIEDQGRKDVVFIPPGDSVLFITKFEDYADPMMPYMFHCHILMHEDAGMMGQFVVTENHMGLSKNGDLEDQFEIYPNPVLNTFSINSKNKDDLSPIQIKMYSVSGVKILDSELNLIDNKVEVSNWDEGIYTIEITQNQVISHKKILVR